MRKLLSAGLVAAFTFSGMGIAVAAPKVTPDACVLVTGTPYTSSSNVKATVGRSGCTNSATWSAKINKDVSFAPDPTIATGSGSNNSTVTLSGACSKQGHGNYYSQVDSSTGATQQSSRASLC